MSNGCKETLCMLQYLEHTYKPCEQKERPVAQNENQGIRNETGQEPASGTTPHLSLQCVLVLLELGGSGLYGISHFSISLAQRHGSADPTPCGGYAGPACCAFSFFFGFLKSKNKAMTVRRFTPIVAKSFQMGYPASQSNIPLNTRVQK